MRLGPPSPETFNPRALRFGLSLTPRAKCSLRSEPKPTAGPPVQASCCTSTAGRGPSTKPDVLEPNPRGGWIAGPSRFFVTARVANRPESSRDRGNGQTNSFSRSRTNTRTDASTSAVWCSNASRRGKGRRQETGSRDSVFTTIGLAGLKSTLRLAADMKGGNTKFGSLHGVFSDMKRLLGVALILLIVVPSPLRAADGDLDTTFGSGGMVITDFGGDDLANAVALQSDGKIVAAGRTQVGGVSSFALVRYNADASLDTTFGTGGKVATDSLGDAFALSIRSDGKIVVAGGRTQSPSTFVLARYNSDGSLDTTFGSGGTVVRTDFSGSYAALLLQPDGKIVVAGGNGDFVLA